MKKEDFKADSAIMSFNQEVDDIVREVSEDFKERKQNKRGIESIFELNINFINGNQYSKINNNGDVVDISREYSWQLNEVYNHIAPVVETRLAKLGRVRPSVSVLSSSQSESDMAIAKMSSKILKASFDKIDLSDVISEATVWSEACGTSFYKIVWDKGVGNVVYDNGEEKMFNGDIAVIAIPPYEIFPHNAGIVDLNSQESIIHAKCYPISYVYERYGIKIDGEKLDIYSMDASSSIDYKIGKLVKKKFDDGVIVIERYIKPCGKYPNGRLTIVAANQLLFDGELPYVNSSDNKREYPFIKQVAIKSPSNFWGTSIVERLIPIQRAYNAIKNRKHEYINRLAGGVVAVEDGSVDMDSLEEDGFAPGKVISYRQGSMPPQFIDSGRVPIDFSYEEERLLNEFVLISGVSEIMRNSIAPTNSTSGVALSLLIEQDETRLSLSAASIKTAVKNIAKQVLRLYKQFSMGGRLSKIAGGEGSVEVFYFSSSDISSEDVILDTESEIVQSPAQKRNLIMEMLRAGLLHDESGNLKDRERAKILDILGFATFLEGRDLDKLQLKRSEEENLMYEKGSDIIPLTIDNHAMHIDQHIKHILSSPIGAIKDKALASILRHIDIHKEYIEKEVLKKQNNGG